MNFLALCKRVLDEADRDPGLLTTVSLDDLEDLQHRKIVNWVKDAYSSLQNENRYWRFQHRYGVMFSLPAGSNTGRVLNIKNFVKDSLIGANNNGQSWVLRYLNYQEFRQVNSLRLNTTGTPVWITQIPSGDFQVFPTPTEATSVSGDWYTANDSLDSACSEPIWDEDLHEILVWMALTQYAYAYDVPSILLRVKEILPRMKRQFVNRYLDDIELVY